MPWAEKHNIYRKNIITPKKKQEKEKKLPWVEQREKTGPCMVAVFFPTLTWIGAPLKKDISLSTHNWNKSSSSSKSAKALRAKKTSLSRRITLYTQLGLVQNYPVTPRRTPTLSRISSELSRIITRCTRAHADIRIYQKYPVTPRRLKIAYYFPHADETTQRENNDSSIYGWMIYKFWSHTKDSSSHYCCWKNEIIYPFKVNAIKKKNRVLFLSCGRNYTKKNNDYSIYGWMIYKFWSHTKKNSSSHYCCWKNEMIYPFKVNAIKKKIACYFSHVDETTHREKNDYSIYGWMIYKFWSHTKKR